MNCLIHPIALYKEPHQRDMMELRQIQDLRAFGLGPAIAVLALLGISLKTEEYPNQL